jgi:tetratricopeptide (TPR) repeat protein
MASCLVTPRVIEIRGSRCIIAAVTDGNGRTEKRQGSMNSRPALLILCVLCIALLGCADQYQPDEADVSFGDAQKAFAAGNHDEALDLLNKSIEKKPAAWAYTLRAKVYVAKKDYAKAQDDTTKGLALDPNNRDLKWLDAELKKPEAQRFQGANKVAPSDVK